MRLTISRAEKTRWWLPKCSIFRNLLEDMAQLSLEEGKPLPIPDPNAADPEADLVELLPLSVEASVSRS